MQLSRTSAYVRSLGPYGVINMTDWALNKDVDMIPFLKNVFSKEIYETVNHKRSVEVKQIARGAKRKSRHSDEIADTSENDERNKEIMSRHFYSSQALLTWLRHCFSNK
jgi:hypothetical protein